MPYSPGTLAVILDYSNGRTWTSIVESNDDSTIEVFVLRFNGVLKFEKESMHTKGRRFKLLWGHYR